MFVLTHGEFARNVAHKSTTGGSTCVTACVTENGAVKLISGKPLRMHHVRWTHALRCMRLSARKTHKCGHSKSPTSSQHESGT